jgi:hypothetical protein
MDIDLTAVADEVAEKIWDARLMLTGQKPYAELDLQHKNVIKEQILPVLFHAVPVIEKSIKGKIDREVIWESGPSDVRNQIKDL